MKKTKKKQKLIIQVSVITFLIFVGSMIYNSISDYNITKDAFLSSKNEMMDRDLLNTTEDINRVYTEWCLRYIRENRDEIFRPMTEEEQKVQDTGRRVVFDALLANENIDFDDADPTEQKYIARYLFYLYLQTLFNSAQKYNYSSIYLLDVTDGNNAYVYMTWYPDKEDDLTSEDSFTGSTASEQFRQISYDASEHSAVKEILSGGLKDEGQTAYEVWYDKETGRSYYIGYTPFIIGGEKIGYQCIQYDWTEFNDQLLNRAVSKTSVSFFVFLVLNFLLTLYFYIKMISPLQKIKAGVVAYMNDKDCGAVSDKMNGITVRNEIGVLADSISDMAVEIDRYTNENLRLNGERERVTAELNLATHIQASQLPNKFPAFPDRNEFDIYASMTPAKEVGGDFYDFFLIDNDHLGLVIADVSGKGVPAAMFMMISKMMIKNFAMSGFSPHEVLERVNENLCENNAEKMFVTVWFGVLEISTGMITAANAGHEYPAVRQPDGRFELLKKKHGFVIGAKKSKKYTEYQFEMKKGASLFVYTDGVPEATNGENILYGTDRMLEALNKEPSASPERLLGNVHSAVNDFVGDAPQFDDLTMMAITVR